jgi:DNA processing protein
VIAGGGTPVQDGAGLPAAAYAAALAGLPGIGPAGLTQLLGRHGPEGAWELVLAGHEQRPPVAPRAGPVRKHMPWDVAARRVDVAALWARLVDMRIGVTFLDQPDYPVALREDLDPPAVLFWRGNLSALARRCVAIIGTRRCTHYGREVAFEMGRDLARSGICVVSGLALGIDGAAHAGALESAAGAGPVGVAASGVDVAYPRAHAGLWLRVSEAGAVVSETAPGQPAQAWRFPARNRIIAGLSSAVVVVESGAGGGSMLTVEAALARGVDVMAVPGPVHSPASAGTNQLLVEGPTPVRHAGDVMDALGDVRPWPSEAQLSFPGTGRLDRQARRILDAVDWTPTPPNVIAERAGLAIAPLSVALHRLEELGLIREHGGRWERVRAR